MDKYEVDEEQGYVDIHIIREGYLDQTGSVGKFDTAINFIFFSDCLENKMDPNSVIKVFSIIL